MVKGRLLLLFILAFTGCSSRLLVSSKGCVSRGKWNFVQREFSTSIGDKFASNKKYQEKYFDYVIEEKIWPPLGQFSREKLMLSELLRLNNLNCSQVKEIEITYFNDFVDIISSVIPLLSSRSILLKVKTF